MSDYTPSPLDTSGIELPDSLDPIIENLSKHVHETWASERLADGWKLGPERSDETREHPCLIPYDELPEEEKKYDRITALNTLKVISKLGYQIIPPENAPAENLEQLSQIENFRKTLRNREPIATSELRSLWDDRIEHLWALNSDIYESLADTLLKRGYPLWANEVLIEGLKVAPRSVRLRQLHALGLMRTGRPRHAREILKSLIAEDAANQTAETQGLLASSYKIQWSSAMESGEKLEALEKCCEIYQTAFEESNDYYPGINAAAMSVMKGDLESGKQIAVQVEQICRESGDESYWTLATLAEASLIAGETDRAVEQYAKAVEVAPDNLASISATRRQAVMLADQLGIDSTAIEHALPVPPVTVFGGLPCWNEGQVFLPTIKNESAFRDQMRKDVRKHQVKVAYASGVAGGDLVFLETVIKEGGEVNLVLPAPAEDLIEYFKEFPEGGADWARRFDQILQSASSISVVSREMGRANSEVFSYANRILAGAAVMRGKSLGTPTSLIQLQQADGSPINAFPDCAIFDEVRQFADPGFSWSTPIETSTGGLVAEVKGILFADLTGYSKMPETEIPLYILEFLQDTAKLCNAESGLQVRNTWGDAFYLVFDSVRAAARFAKQLRLFVKETNWKARGFSNEFGIRIALHAGPLFSFVDPVIDRPTFTGQHCSRAARIEPITDEGQIFVSEPFACLAAEGNAPELQFEYLGRRTLAKKYGGEGLYMLL